MRKIGHAAKFYGSSVVDLHEFLTLPLPTISTESKSNQVLVGRDVFCFPSLKVFTSDKICSHSVSLLTQDWRAWQAQVWSPQSKPRPAQVKATGPWLWASQSYTYQFHNGITTRLATFLFPWICLLWFYKNRSLISLQISGGGKIELNHAIFSVGGLIS